MLYTILYALTLFSFGFGEDSIIYLKQRHFDTGTLRITRPGKYQLIEDIVFNPRSNVADPNCEGAYYPMENEGQLYPGADCVPGAFRLGFFAAIVIETNNVEIDLNGKEIKASHEFYIQQRFYTNIEIGSAPFIQGQGSANFGPFLSPESGVSDIVITNGRLGRSSHHGIHSNAARNVIISKVRIYDFEVAGIHMNHFTNVTIRDVDIGPSAINVPVTGSWGSARFDILNFRYLRDSHGDQVVNFANRMETKTVEEIVDELQTIMDILVDKFVSGELKELDFDEDPVYRQKIHEDLYEYALPVFINKDGLPDGSSLYGIVLNSRGAAVQWFGSAKSRGQDAKIENVRIHDLNNKPTEFGAYRDSHGFINTGPYREVFNLFATMDIGRESWNNAYGVQWRNLAYRGNVFSDAQIALAIYGDTGERGKVQSTISDDIINWVTKGDALPSTGQLICDGDIMFHAAKGLVGLRIDNIDSVFINNVEINYLNNWGELGKYTCKDSDNNYISHPAIPTKQYEGMAARAISVSNSQNVLMGNIRINNIASAHGNSYGVQIFDAISDVEFYSDVYIDEIAAGNCLTQADLGRLTNDPTPNPVPVACGFTNINQPGIAYTHVSNINGPTVCS